MRRFIFILLAILYTTPAQAQKWVWFHETPSDSAHVLSVPEFPLVSTFAPPEVYAEWWRKTETCSGYYITQQTKDAIKFVVVWSPGFMFDGYQGLFAGYTQGTAGMILLDSDSVLNEEIVRHEMLHYLMWQRGIPAGHPIALFKKKCGLRPY